MHPRHIVISGAGIAGLTAAIAFARRGFAVRILERAAALEEVGAGLQISPNATRILSRLGVLDIVAPLTVRPEAVVLRDATTLKERASVPLGASAERRWKAPYLVAHRADLQSALLARANEIDSIELSLGTSVTDVQLRSDGITVSFDQNGISSEVSASLFVAADGVWSHSRRLVGPNEKSRFSGSLAWRTTLLADSDAGCHFAAFSSPEMVTTYLHGGFHLVAYPIRAASAINLAAFTPGRAITEHWAGETSPDALRQAMRDAAPQLAELADKAAPWTIWPLHTVDASRPWTSPGGIALIGDAAHAMTPFAAQGAAMAIEDAYMLADAVASATSTAQALSQWEAARKPRVAQVARRGALNHFAWNASGPVALARNLFLKLKSPDSLAADMDWLYGWTPPGWAEDGAL
ncbi:FAD-dependent monooxygenase [Hoeflea sp. 108]|uniref:FAD-dependent monooxygenase n=1 Tax=Hoeflea sp. 108 TaxID=1116369 RepID=UPI000379620B|nr:FAD-dependent monooxygenase [Hoeflea sp. 108]